VVGSHDNALGRHCNREDGRMISLFRYSHSIYGGGDQLIGASWDLLPWFVAAALIFIVLHAIVAAIAKRRERGLH
jgi:hypothetical protein